MSHAAMINADFPTRPEAITASWLSATLQSQVNLNGTILESVEFAAATAQKSIIGEVVRLKLHYDRASSTMPQSLIAKFPTPQPERRAYFASLGMYKREVYFYQQLAEKIALRIPRCYFAAWDAQHERGLLLLEDLAPARAGNRIAGCTVAQAEHVIGEIACLHIDWWENPLLAQFDWLGIFDLQFFQERYRQSWQALPDNLIETLPAMVISLGQQLVAKPDSLAALWQAPLTLIHRDLQLDNIFFVEDGPPFIVDWQLIMQGRGVFDVANFLCWNLDPAVRRDHEMRILRQYHAGLLAGGVQDYDWQQCVADYRLSLMESFARVVAILGQNLIIDQTLSSVLETLLSRTASALVENEVELLN